MPKNIFWLSKDRILRPLSIAIRGNVCKALFFVAISLFFFSSIVLANNLSISNVSVVGWDTEADTAQVKFDIAWDNAWRDATNYDAAWVFIKYSTDAGSTWNHATLAHQGHTIKVGTEIVLPTDYKGAFIQFSATTSSHSMDVDDVKLVWDYGKDGVSDSQAKDSANTKVKVFGIEMVYIPQGSFYVGDTASSASFEAGTSGAVFQVTGEGALTLGGGGAGSLGNNNNETSTEDFDDSTIEELPAAFPKGYAPFYLMKYEMSQGQYVDFLNILSRVQQNTRTATDVSGTSVTNEFVMSNTPTAEWRNTIQCANSGLGTSPTKVIFNTGSRDSRAAGYLSWQDLMAYADWAGLRPFTELEFEKAARGTAAASPGEYVWGTGNITQCGTISGTENGTETCATAGANCSYDNSSEFSGGDGGSGPLRVGIFSTASTTTREGSGAGFYGNLDLGGSLEEAIVTVGNGSGRAFTGTHGDGILTTSGNATNVDWPGIDSTPANGVTGGEGAGSRGGDFWTVLGTPSISDRSYAGGGGGDRYEYFGGRLARTAPE